MKKDNNPSGFLFSKQNYTLLLVSFAIIALSFILMGGASNDDPTQFNEAIYSFRRIHLAPAVFFIGIGVAIYSIFKKDKKQS
ncbi:MULTISPECIES: DUF3098 domain-containing protein [Myroides]|jgi:hypothetical protein|uniref:DUF3098 domain-containing protein n=1 Tax=Myroides odoratus TaxID=256 RepID=A0A9Q6ZFG6_MYROD|nr:DUF3098 domain-containing protein [Myroides odoratus]EHQ43085.1 hypothetical protein Myrod_2259 [Myroides odoratus DSM 2801]EKB06466.1 hypothetical protein HMPREF9716_02121 [Myroides odoratus CIP 103059]MDR0223989.1 DUF3098 domain-containing protein [Myroides odoratus]QQU00430.1 DUF3098 domain-containing protein [Myroides odoratus]WQD57337.1 DUF3098 domain-containing protein [Myroides odoratus]